jgi:hypothetical protein
MALTPTINRAEAALRRQHIHTLLGSKTPAEIRVWAGSDPDLVWAHSIADGLAMSGFLTLSDITEDEFDEIIN